MNYLCIWYFINVKRCYIDWLGPLIYRKHSIGSTQNIVLNYVITMCDMIAITHMYLLWLMCHSFCYINPRFGAPPLVKGNLLPDLWMSVMREQIIFWYTCKNLSINTYILTNTPYRRWYSLGKQISSKNTCHKTDNSFLLSIRKVRLTYLLHDQTSSDHECTQQQKNINTQTRNWGGVIST